MVDRFQPKSVRKKDRARNAPTPQATERISTISGTEGIWWASTFRSGSAMVIMAPMKKHSSAMIPSFLNLAMRLPTCSPMGIMAMSAPRVKKPMPIISRHAPARNSVSGARGMGVTVMQSATTMTVMGRTADRDSAIFSLSFLFKSPRPPFLSFLPIITWIR